MANYLSTDLNRHHGNHSSIGTGHQASDCRPFCPHGPHGAASEHLSLLSTSGLDHLQAPERFHRSLLLVLVLVPPGPNSRAHQFEHHRSSPRTTRFTSYGRMSAAQPRQTGPRCPKTSSPRPTGSHWRAAPRTARTDLTSNHDATSDGGGRAWKLSKQLGVRSSVPPRDLSRLD